jgi:hypothetical protein
MPPPPQSAQPSGGDKVATKSGDAAIAPNPDLERVEGIQAHITSIRAHEVELGVMLSELDVQHAIKLRELEAAHKEAVEVVAAKREMVQAQIKVTESELTLAVDAPVSGGRDPTEWLPDELMLMVLERLSSATLWSGACERVCHYYGLVG